jgi:hypothetical protein
MRSSYYLCCVNWWAEVKPIEDKMKLLNIAVQEFVAGVARLELATFRFGDGRSTN